MLQTATDGQSKRKPVVWTIEAVEDHLLAAGRALRQSPPIDEQHIGRMRAAWPAFAETQEEIAIRDWMEQIGLILGTAPKRRPRLHEPASQADMNALDDVIVWHGILRPGARKIYPMRDGGRTITMPPDVWGIIFARACGVSWRAIVRKRKIKNHHEHVRRIYRAAVALLAQRLNSAQKFE